MKTAFRLAALAAALAPVSALAHAGDHGHVEDGLVVHLLESPLHAGVVALMLALIGYAALRGALPVRTSIKRKRD